LETVAVRRFPIIENVKKELLNQGALGSLMTGSGSAVFGLFADMPAAHSAANQLNSRPDWQIYATKLRC
jgi:4-diphosphocytidyl-2-C-methyl-D-erythritol kinase